MDTPDDGEVKENLQSLLSDKVIRGYPVADFIYAVWGVRKEDLKLRKGDLFPRLDRSPYHEYIYSTYTTKSNEGAGERKAYWPLFNIFTNIYNAVQFKEASRNAAAACAPRLVNMKDNVVRSSFAAYKPDFLWTWREADVTQDWLPVAGSGELKKYDQGMKESNPNDRDLAIDMSQVPEVSDLCDKH